MEIIDRRNSSVFTFSNLSCGQTFMYKDRLFMVTNDGRAVCMSSGALAVFEDHYLVEPVECVVTIKSCN